MRRCAALLLLVSASLPGCGLTGYVWTGVVREDPLPWQMPLSVRVSPEGDVVIVYWAGADTPDTLEDALEVMGWLTQGKPPYTGFLARRGLVVPAAEMQRLLSARSGAAVTVVREEDLAKFVRPADPQSRRNFEESSVPGLAQWPEVLRGPCPAGRDQTEARSFKIQFAYGRRGETHVGEGPGKAKEVAVQMNLPTRSSAAVRSYPLRVLLTPPAVLADVGKDATLGAVHVVIAAVSLPVFVLLIINPPRIAVP